MMNDLKILDLTGVALAHMFVLGFMIWAGGNISGGHYNGAVSLATYITGHISAVKMVCYFGVQFLGSLIAGSFLFAFRRSYLGDKAKFTSELGFPHCNVKSFHTGTCFTVEMIATFFLVFMVYATAVSATKPKSEVHGLTIGGALGMAVLSIGPITGAALNPWRVLGPAIVSGALFTAKYDYAWVYYIGCPLGGAICALLWRFLYMVDFEKKEGNNDDVEIREPLNQSESHPVANH